MLKKIKYWHVITLIFVSVLGYAILMNEDWEKERILDRQNAEIERILNEDPAPIVPAPRPKTVVHPPNSPSMSKGEFITIQNGMTYDEVTSIVGGRGELLSEYGTPGSKNYTASYSYEGEGSVGANALLMFQNGKLKSKSQHGLGEY